MSWSDAGSWSKAWTLLICLGLAGCGFRPLYGEAAKGQTNTTSELARVEVGPIKDRIGQLVRNHLLDQLTPKGGKLAPHYRLKVELTTSQEGVALARDEAATRFNLQLRGRYALIELQNKREIFQGTARSIAVYNVVSADYSTLTAEADAKRRAAREISDEIKTRLAVFFSRRSAAR